MNEVSNDGNNSDDEILAEILLKVERAGDETVQLTPYIERYPHLASEIRELLQMQNVVDRTRPLSDLPTPKRLGDFRIKREIARGGMGVVYEAVQEPLMRSVAVKTIRANLISADLRDRFLREQQVLAELHQTNIVPIHAAGEQGPLQYFAMPYIDGASLSQVISAVSKFGTTGRGNETPTLGVLAGRAKSDSEKKNGGDPASTASLPPEHQETVIGPDGHTDDVPRPADGPPMRRSIHYFRSVARVMADVADAIHHAHQLNILHRDLKPSNIMVDAPSDKSKHEQCWIIDFGLAAYLSQGNGEPSEAADSAPVSFPHAASLIGGTPPYMAPEQFDGVAEKRSDVWGLGVTLYELLALKRAFSGGKTVAEIEERVRHEEPPSPRKVAGDVPADLDAITRKAMRKRADDRYQTADEFAADLRRWLDDVPPLAGKAGPVRRVWKWSRRNKGWASAISTSFLAFIALSVGAFLFQKSQAEAAQKQERETRRQSRIQESQKIRLTPHFDGWREKAWQAIREASEIQRDNTVRDQAAATLVGLDARISKHFPLPASSVTFSGDGKRLLLGGAGVWNSKTDLLHPLRMAGQGPAIFTEDGAVLQLVPKTLQFYFLLNATVQKKVREFEIPMDDGLPTGDSPPGLEMALSAAASYVAAAPTFADDTGTLAVWDATTGKLLRQFEQRATGLAFSPDEKLLAAGDANGQITVWSLPDMKEVARIKSGRNEIHCLAFSKDRMRRDMPVGAPQPKTNWLLAAGDAGGSVTVWEVKTQFLRNRLYGGHYDIFAVAFSPDGNTLAAGGRGFSKLWDLSRGTRLLDLNSGDYITGIEFSPDGRQLAISTGVPTENASFVWNLEYGRGIQTLRGLTAQVTKSAFSPDGKLVASLAHDWIIGVWNAKTGHLLHLLETPKGLYADNAALAFSPDGRRLAFSTGSAARLWDLETGKVVKRWKLPFGLADVLSFDSKGRLHSFRMETANAQPQGSRRVSRIRVLPVEGPAKLIAEYNDHGGRVRMAVGDLQGLYFVADGDQGPEAKGRTIRAYEAATVKRLWSIPVNSNLTEVLGLDPSGTVLFAMIKDHSQTELLQMPSRQLLGTVPVRLSCVSGNANWLLTHGPTGLHGRWYGYSLYRRDGNEPVVSLDIDKRLIGRFPQFSPDSSRVVWGNSDGTVTLCTLKTVRERLAKLRLGW